MLEHVVAVPVRLVTAAVVHVLLGRYRERVLKVAVDQWAPHIVVAWVHDDVALALCLRERKDRGLLKIGRKRIFIIGLK